MPPSVSRCRCWLAPKGSEKEMLAAYLAFKQVYSR